MECGWLRSKSDPGLFGGPGSDAKCNAYNSMPQTCRPRQRAGAAGAGRPGPVPPMPVVELGALYGSKFAACLS